MIEEHLQKFIKQFKLQNKTIIVGFSGGYDSMCLLNALNNIRQKNSLILVGAHFNHNWRGETARKEQIRCEEFCKDLGIEFYTETADNNTKKNETVARELRYKFFERVQKKYNTNIVFTAHNFNDNAETVFYRIVKGTGLTGLKGIEEVRGNYYRPLLQISRADIEQYCIKNSLNPNNDDSNFDNIHKRNLIRHEIFPLLKEINTNVINSLNTLAQVSKCELDILEEYLGAVKKKIYKGNSILTSEFAKLSKNLQQKIIYDYIYNSKVDYDYKLIENAVDFLRKAIENNVISKFSLTMDCWLYVDSNIIEIAEKQEKNDLVIEITSSGEYEYNNNIIKITENDDIKKISKNEFCVNVDLSNYKTLYIRTRKDGDIIQPLGTNGKMKLKKYLMSKKIPQHKRDNLILLCDDKEVLWVAGVGLSDKIKVITTSTHRLELLKNE